MNNSHKRILLGLDTIINPKSYNNELNVLSIIDLLVNDKLIQPTKVKPVNKIINNIKNFNNKTEFPKKTEHPKENYNIFESIKEEPIKEEPIKEETIKEQDDDFREEFIPVKFREPIDYKINDNFINEINIKTSTYKPTETYIETDEEKKKNLIRSILNSNDSDERNENENKIEIFSLEQEKQEDAKCFMLSEIDTIISYLNDDNVDISRIPKVTSESTYKEIETVLKILKNKNDFNRYCSFADEIIIFGSHVLEEVFDGEKKYLGYSPNLTGWHNSVSVKIKRMKHDTSQIVSTVMENNGIGPITRILLELIPNMFLYSKTNKKRK